MKKRRKKLQTKKERNRILTMFMVFVICFTALIFRTGWHQIIKGDEYARKASRQQTSDSIVKAFRGNIFDRNGNALALSATTHTVWVRPSDIKKNGETQNEVAENAMAEAIQIAGVLDMVYSEVYEILVSNTSVTRLAKQVSEEKADELRSLNLIGVDIIEDSIRRYPMGAFASQIIGITTDDNVGLTGLELYYDDYLSGTNGRWISSADNKGNTLIFGNNKYYNASDGYTIVTTIDSNVERIIKEKIAKYQEIYQPKRVSVVVIAPKTGEILGMAQSDEFDLNNPRSAREGDEEYYSTLTQSEQVEYWSQMWRNFCVSDVYEPGSTFKPITVALALDNGITYMDDTFYCSGYRDVEDWTIHCWNYPDRHGYQNLTDSLINSCNSVMIELVQRLGRANYFNGLRTFCITEKTGVDYPGEASNLVYAEKEVGPVELATMAFGQGIAVTPISLISAVSSFANEGKLMQPHFVKQILDSDGNAVESVEPIVKNITVSEETAANMMQMLEQSCIYNGGGISGYRIAGKTGTAYKARDGIYSEAVITSFFGIGPIEDPQFAVLVVMDEPNYESSVTATQCEREIMQELLLLKNIAPNYSEAQLQTMRSGYVEVPDLTDFSLDDAIGYITSLELVPSVSSDPGNYYHEICVIDQYPKAGSSVSKGSTVTLYYK